MRNIYSKMKLTSKQRQLVQEHVVAGRRELQKLREERDRLLREMGPDEYRVDTQHIVNSLIEEKFRPIIENIVADAVDRMFNVVRYAMIRELRTQFANNDYSSTDFDFFVEDNVDLVDKLEKTMNDAMKIFVAKAAAEIIGGREGPYE